MIELVRNRHLRAKIACFALFYYIIFHSSGLIWLIGQYSESESHIKWSDPSFWAILSSIVFQTAGIAIWLYLCFIIVFTHRQYYSDTKWQYRIKKFVQISSGFYCVGILLLLIEALQLQAYFFEVYLVLMNKTFVLMLIYNIHYDLNLKKKRRERLLLYGEILEFFSLCHALFLSIIYLYYLFLGSPVQWLVFVPMCCFWCIFCVSFQYSFVGQRACKKCCDMDRNINTSTSQGKKCCPYGPKNVADHLLMASTILLLYANIIFNYNTCLSYNNSFENIFSIRGYAFLNFYYCILMAVEFNFGGLPNNKQSNMEELAMSNANTQNPTDPNAHSDVVPTQQLL